MLKDPRSGDRAFLGDVPDEEDRYPDLFGQAHQPSRGLADLCDAAGAAFETGIGDRLYRVDDCQLRRF